MWPYAILHDPVWLYQWGSHHHHMWHYTTNILHDPTQLYVIYVILCDPTWLYAILHDPTWHYAIEFFMIGFLSDYLIDLYTGKRKKIKQKLPPVGIETRTSGSSGQCSTNWAKSTFSFHPESSWPLKSHALLILEMNKVQHLKWCMKQTKLTSEISCSTDLLPSSVGRALAWWSGGPDFNPHWGQFFDDFVLPFPVQRSVR